MFVDQSERGDINPDALESYLLSLNQAPCTVIHRFRPGVYIREVTIPKGAIAVGHRQRYEHLNILTRGSVAMIGDDGQVKVISAPATFVGKPGREVGGCIEECSWQNVYPNPDNCRDIEALEAQWLEKSNAAAEYERLKFDRVEVYYSKWIGD